LRRYQAVLSEYGFASEDSVRVVATTAVREAVNRLAFRDRLYVATGLNVESIDEQEVNRITYVGVYPHLQAFRELADGKALVIEVGGGNTETLVVRGGNVLSSHSFRLGSMRLLHTLQDIRGNTDRRRSLMESHIRRYLDQIKDAVSHEQQMHLVALGGDIRLAMSHLHEDWDRKSIARLSVDSLGNLTNEVLKYSDDEIVKRFSVSYVEATTLGPALLVYHRLAQQFNVSEMYVCDTNLRDGLLHDMAVQGTWTEEFRTQIVRSALGLGRKFAFDETHARNVAELSRSIFLQLRAEHGLNSRHEVILFVAALLHEIGLIVNLRSNHKHALYLIRNSDLFGLSKSELLLVGLVARYHRRASPQSSHDSYSSLPQADRVVVNKLAAILRIAIALDDTRSGRVREIRCTAKERQLMIEVYGVEDISLEQISMREQCGLFRDVFGLSVILQVAK
ncbi:MAG: exopolyphosphatase, partial [Rubripirellula sp.]